MKIYYFSELTWESRADFTNPEHFEPEESLIACEFAVIE
jgi:hypothetical protein